MIENQINVAIEIESDKLLCATGYVVPVYLSENGTNWTLFTEKFSLCKI